MTGTQPMTDFATRTIVRLSAGLSKAPRQKFAWGTQVDPISVGVRGQWAILADGLQDIHLFLGFDGRQVLVASAGPAARVLVNGQPLQGPGWVPVMVPGKIELGEAVLRVENEGPALTLPKPATAPPDPALAATDVVQSQAFAATEAQPGPAFAASDALASSSMDTMFDGGALRERGRALSAPPVRTPTAEAPLLATLQSAAAVREPPPSTPPTALTTPPSKKGAWAEASVPKKAIFVLMPFALASTLWVILDDAPPPSVRAAAAAASVAPSARPASAAAQAPSATPAAEVTTRRASIAKDPPTPQSNAAASATSAPSAASAPSATSAAVARSGATPRAAVNAALLGNLTQANELYAQLSSENPNNAAYVLATRLTAARAVRRP